MPHRSGRNIVSLIHLVLFLRIEHENDPMGVPGDGRPWSLEAVIAGGVPQLNVSTDQATVNVQVTEDKNGC